MNDKPKYNPKIHHRRSIRLKGYDYSQAGLYFITICCEGRECRFGEIVNDEIMLNEYGSIAYNRWINLTERFSNFELDVFQIMPNHMHGIIVLNDVGAGFTPAQNGQPQGLPLQNTDDDDRAHVDGAHVYRAPTIGDIVGAYKSLVANGCLDIFKFKNEKMRKLWQRNYYEHIIRSEQSYQTISEYIISNPAKWKDDKFYK
ncbi:MAG: transposase [Saprospiraceae bacterium]|nr:transposase [Saprospiraceae bacterium]